MNTGDLTETISLQPIEGAPSASKQARRGRTRRRHPAMASRIIVTGVSGSAFLGSIAGIAANPPTWSTKPVTSAAGAPAVDATIVVPTTMVIEHVARTFYVDQAGHPVAPPTSTSAPVGWVAPPDAVVAARKAVGSAPSAAVATPATSVTTAAAPSVTTAPAPGAAPATTAPPAPATTVSPAPASTAPPTTAAPAPKPTTPPTTVPACKTSKPC